MDPRSCLAETLCLCYGYLPVGLTPSKERGLFEGRTWLSLLYSQRHVHLVHCCSSSTSSKGENRRKGSKEMAEEGTHPAFCFLLPGCHLSLSEYIQLYTAERTRSSQVPSKPQWRVKTWPYQKNCNITALLRGWDWKARWKRKKKKRTGREVLRKGALPTVNQ